MAISRTDYTTQAASKGYGEIEVGKKDDIIKDSELRFLRGELETNTGEKLYGTGVNDVYEINKYDQNDQLVKSLQDTEGNTFTYVLDLNGESWKLGDGEGAKTGNYRAFHTNADGETKQFIFSQYSINSDGEISLTTPDDIEKEEVELKKAQEIEEAQRETRLANNAVLGYGEIALSENGTITLNNGATLTGLGAEGDTVTVEHTEESNVWKVITGSGKEFTVSAKNTPNGVETEVLTPNDYGSFDITRYSPDPNGQVQMYESRMANLENTPFASVNVDPSSIDAIAPEGMRVDETNQQAPNV